MAISGKMKAILVIAVVGGTILTAVGITIGSSNAASNGGSWFAPPERRITTLNSSYFSILGQGYITIKDPMQTIAIFASPSLTNGWCQYEVSETDADLADKLDVESLYLSNGTSKIFVSIDASGMFFHALFKIDTIWYLAPAQMSVVESYDFMTSYMHTLNATCRVY